jgi:ADP-heptose:LPS heptosyltransferase
MIIRHAPKRIVVFRIGQLGDMIVALPAFWALRKYFPLAHIALLSDLHLGKDYVTPEMVLPNKGLFNEYIDYSANKNRTGSALLMISLLRRAKYDTLAYLYPQGRSRCFFILLELIVL